MICLLFRAKYDFDYEEFDAVSPEAKDFISRLLRRKSESRMSSSECLGHCWLAENERNSKSGTIRIENLRKFLARRKLKNVGRVLRAINVFRETARESRYIVASPNHVIIFCSRSRSREADSDDSEDEEDLEVRLQNIDLDNAEDIWPSLYPL